jgi:Domain of unknown function (DUF4436)
MTSGPNVRARRRRAASAALGLSAVLLLAYSVASISLRPAATTAEGLDQMIDCGTQDWSTVAGVSIDPTSACPNAVELNLEVTNAPTVDEQFVRAGSQLFPTGAYGGTVVNGGWASRSISIEGDSQDSSEWLILANSFIGGRPIQLPTKSVDGIENYPLDTYTTNWTGIVVDAVTAERIPVVLTAQTSPVSGFDIQVTRVEMEGDAASPIQHNPHGRFSYALGAQRDPAVRFQVALLVFTVVVGGLAALFMTILIVCRRRPPSLGALGWLATFLFALLEVRRNFPGDPPVGVRLDALVTFPVIALIMMQIVVVAVSWRRRVDWDMENHDPSELGLER